jgi:hypothetical protein
MTCEAGPAVRAASRGIQQLVADTDIAGNQAQLAWPAARAAIRARDYC